MFSFREFLLKKVAKKLKESEKRKSPSIYPKSVFNPLSLGKRIISFVDVCMCVFMRGVGVCVSARPGPGDPV